MFFGEYQHSIDPKGRVAVPAKFRRGLENGLVVTSGLDSCLLIYPKDEWLKRAQKVLEHPIENTSARAYHRFMFGSAMDAECDSQGRILISDRLRSYAGRREKVVMVGLFNRIEVWDEEQWKKYKTQLDKDGTQIAEQISSL